MRGLAAMLGVDGTCQWIGEAGSTAESLRLAPHVQPDVVLIDHRPPVTDAMAGIATLQAVWPAARFVVLASRLDAGDVSRAMAAGASCVLHTSVSAADLSSTVRAVHDGMRVVSPSVAVALDDAVDDGLSRDGLTPRERLLVGLLAQGMDNKTIGAAMGITVPTVKFHVTNVMSKLHAPNRTAAVLAALRMRIITLQSEGGDA